MFSLSIIALFGYNSVIVSFITTAPEEVYRDDSGKAHKQSKKRNSRDSALAHSSPEEVEKSAPRKRKKRNHHSQRTESQETESDDEGTFNLRLHVCFIDL